MVNIADLEEGVMIEVNEWDYPLSNLVNDVMVSGKELMQEEVYRYASNIAASLFTEGYITIKKSTYTINGNGSIEPVSSRDLTEEELNYILKESEKWDEGTIMSIENVFELVVTEKGRSYLCRED